MPARLGSEFMNLKPYEIPSSLLVLHPVLAKQDDAAVKLVMPLVLSFTAGTGGTMTAHGAEMLDRWAYDPSIHVERPTVRSIDTRSPAEHVALIRDAFALNMSELAAVLGVT